MFRKIVKRVIPKFLKSYIRFYRDLTPAARAEHRKDRKGLPTYDPGIETAIKECIDWLCRAQDASASHDGGVAAYYSLLTGWSTSYPETTGYIIPTMLEYAELTKDKKIRQRAKRMLDWLVSIQFSEGGFQGGLIGDETIIPNTFNTGQVLLGLAAGVRKFGNKYRDSMIRAADWLVKTQDYDGCWRKFPSHLAIPGEKTYETHVAWGLLEAARLETGRGYEVASLKNIRWAIKFQRENGWFDNCCLDDPSKPLTHTLGYVFRGILEAYQYFEDPVIFSACKKIADGLLTAISNSGFLAGRLFSDWSGAVSWVCLTGNVQIAYCLLKLYQINDNADYHNAAYALNRYVRRTIKINGPPDTRGAVKGSFPVYGEYGKYNYYNWGCKFFIDSNMLEKDVREENSRVTTTVLK